MILTFIIIFLTGISVGFVSTVFGIGGGIIMVPLLSLLFSISHLEAMATSLATIVLVTTYNTINFNKKKVINWSIVPWIGLVSAACAFIASRVSLILPTHILIIIFLILLFYVAFYLIFVKELKSKYSTGKIKHFISFAIGGTSGSISGLTGVGGGAVITPMILVTGLTNNIQAAPTSNAIMIFTTFFSSLSFALAEPGIQDRFTLGYIHLDIAFLLFLGSAVFSHIGVKINEHFTLFWRKTGLAIILLFVCIRILFML